MSVSVRLAGRADLHDAVTVMTAAFWTYPETVHLLPGERARRGALPRFLRADLVDSLDLGGLFVAERDGRIVGAAAWVPPGAYPIPLRRQVRQVRILAPAAPVALRAAIEGQRGRSTVRADHRSKPPHWFLRALGVDPAVQHAGAGTALLRPIMTRADHEEQGCYLTTAAPGNVAWYHRLAFETTATFHPTPTWPQVWSMWRPPQRRQPPWG